MAPVGAVVACLFICGWNETDLVMCRSLPLFNGMLLTFQLKGVHGVSLSARCIDDNDLELHKGGSEVVDSTTDLHWFVVVPMAASLQDCQGRVGACCLVCGLNH